MRPLLALAAFSLAASGQGIPVRSFEPAPKAPPSGRPWPVRFTDVSTPAGLTAPFLSGLPLTKKYIVEANGAGLAFFDYNNDNYPDIFLLNSARFAKGPTPTNHLYRNNKNGTFTDVTAQAGLTRSGWGNGLCSGDVNNDGHEDLFLTYWGPNALYLNKNGVFTEVTQAAGLARPGKEWSSGCTFLDYDRDGHLDLFIAQYLDFDPAKTPLPGAAPYCQWKGMPVFCGPRGLPYGRALLYRNQGNGTFTDVTQASGIAAAKDFYAFTTLAADLNADGWTDLYVACDATPSLFFRNNKNGTFSEIGAEAGVAFNEHGQEQSGMGAAVGDFDNDGRLDVLIQNMDAPPTLLRNSGAPLGNWLKLLLQGTQSNRSAIGSTVRLLGQTEAVASQSSYLSVNDRRLHFGLGSAQQVDSIAVRWPSGQTELFGPYPANQTVTLVEGSGRRP